MKRIWMVFFVLALVLGAGSVFAGTMPAGDPVEVVFGGDEVVLTENGAAAGDVSGAAAGDINPSVGFSAGWWNGGAEITPRLYNIKPGTLVEEFIVSEYVGDVRPVTKYRFTKWRRAVNRRDLETSRNHSPSDRALVKLPGMYIAWVRLTEPDRPAKFFGPVMFNIPEVSFGAMTAKECDGKVFLTLGIYPVFIGNPEGQEVEVWFGNAYSMGIVQSDIWGNFFVQMEFAIGDYVPGYHDFTVRLGGVDWSQQNFWLPGATPSCP